MTKTILTGERIRLRSMREKDISFIVRLHFDPEVLKWTVNSDLTVTTKIKRESIKYLKNFIKKKPKTEKMFVVEVKNGDLWKSIGHCGLSNIEEISRCAKFFITLDPNYPRGGLWNRGD